MPAIKEDEEVSAVDEQVVAQDAADEDGAVRHQSKLPLCG